MQLHTTSHRWRADHVDTERPFSTAEIGLAAAIVLLMLLAVALPPTALPAGYHAFADQRTLLGVPHALDVLTNLPFALMGAWGWLSLRRHASPAIGATQRALAGLFFGGLLLTTLCSAGYHLAPDHAGLCVDRLGMSLAFAGLLGLAAADRVSARAGVAVALLVGVAAPLSAVIALLAQNMTPWAVLQGGGLALLAALALRRPVVGATGFSIVAVIACYGVAKLLELADAPVFALSQQLISGHSAKHLVAALAAWPVVRALHPPQSGSPA